MKTLQFAILMFWLSSLAEATTLKTSFYKSGTVTARGEAFNPYGNTAASNNYRFGTILQLSYKGKSTRVCISDTGGFSKYHRDLDVSIGIAKKLNFVKKGVVTLESKVIFKPKKNISCTTAWRLI